MKKRIFGKFLAILTTAMLLVGMLPAGAFALPQKASDPVSLDVDLSEGKGEQEAAQVTVRFLAFDGTELLAVTLAAGSSVEAKDWPKADRDGYAFLGWSDGAQIVTALDALQADVTLTAQYAKLYSVRFEDWDGTLLSTVDHINEGSRFVSAEHSKEPQRDGYVFAGWEPAVIGALQGNETAVATYTPLTQYTVTINYVYENQRQASDPYVATVYDGYHFTDSVTSPAIAGYTADVPVVTLSEPVTQDIDILVTYSSRLDTPYQIVYLLQDLTGDTYSEDTAHRVSATGRTGSLTAVTQAQALTYPGFTLATDIATCNEYIAADGSTEIELRYTRDIHNVLFDTADGTCILPQTGRYGLAVTKPANPSRAGYTFDGWNPQVPQTIGTADVTCVAKWKPLKVQYTVVFWRQNANDDLYSYAGISTAQAYAGSTVTTAGAGPSDAAAKHFAYASCDTVVVNGNGTTVQNVYYSRNSYTLSFLLKDKNAYLNVNGASYKGSKDSVDYTFTARYEQDISRQWPTNVYNKDGGLLPFTGWKDNNGEINLSRRITLTNDLLTASYWGTVGSTFEALYAGNLKDTLVYMLETTDDTGELHSYGSVSSHFAASTDFGQTVYTTLDRWGNGCGWNYKNISGFTPLNIEYGWIYNGARTVTLYYTRNKAAIQFHNGGETSTVSDIYFGAVIADRYWAPASPPTGISPDCTFTGWYTDSTYNEKSLFAWQNATMPASGLILYAGWQLPSFAVTFDLNYEGGGTYQSLSILKGSAVPGFAAPARDGYRFDYWYYEDGGVQKIFAFSTPITRDYGIKAHWTPVAVAYSARYVDVNGNAVLGADGKTLTAKAGLGYVGQTVTETAPAAHNGSGEALFPDRISSSIVLKPGAAQNVITFVYTRISTVYYRVRYVDAMGVEKAPAKGPVATSKATVTENYVNVGGYSPSAYQQTLVLAAETDPSNITQNVITFVYSPNPTGRYTVKRYLQNLNDNGYTCDTAATETFTDAPLGSTVRAAGRSYEGFTLVPGISKVSGVVYTSAGDPLTLCVYYNRNLVAYGASYIDGLTDETVQADAAGKARFGADVTLYAPDIAGYRLDETRGNATQTVHISADASANRAAFYYLPSEGLTVRIRFVDRKNNPLAETIVYTANNNANVRLGKTFQYVLPAEALSLQLNGDDYDLSAGVDRTQSLTVAQGDNFLTYTYDVRTHTLTFDANGGAGAPAPAEYAHKDLVPLPMAGVSYGANTLEGWSSSEGVRGNVYTSEAQLSLVSLVSDPYSMMNRDVTLYAVWSRMTATLTYACDTAYTGSLPAAVTANLGEAVTVSGAGSLARAGYTFAGWKLKNDLGQPVDPAYGPQAGWSQTLTLNASATLYATWAAVDYTISYDNNLPAAARARFVNANTAAAYTAESAPITLLDAACEGYTFQGWYTDSTYGTPAAAVALPTGSTGNRTFYAKFTVAPVDGVSATDYSGVYDGATHNVALNDPNGRLLLDSGIDTVAYSATGFIHATDGNVPVTVTVRRDGAVIWTGSANVNIARKPISLSADDISAVYSGGMNTLSVTVPTGESGAVNNADAQAIRNALTFRVAGAAVTNAFTDAMAETVVTVASTHADYVIAPAYPKVTIAKRPVTITAGSDTAVYDGLLHTVNDWAVAPPDDDTGLVSGDSVVSVAFADNALRNVGVAYPSASNAVMGTGNADNYTFQYKTGVLEITQSDALTLAVAAGEGAYVYDGQSHGFTFDTAGVPVQLSYSVNGSAWQALADGDALPAFMDAGTYTLSLRASNTNFSNTPQASVKLTITPRPLTLRAGTLSHAYTGAEFAMTDWSVDAASAGTGLVGAQTVETVALAGNVRTVPGVSEVTVSPATWGGGANPNNYAVQTVNGQIEITVNPGMPAITLDGLTLTYDGTQHTLRYAVQTPEECPYTVYYSLNGGDWVKLRAGASLPGKTDAGNYAFSMKVESEYYAQAGTAEAALNILQRPLTLSVNSSLGNVYNGAAYTVGYTVSDAGESSGLVDGDTVHAQLTGDTQTNAGLYAVTFLPAETRIRHGSANVTANYAVDYVDGTLEILKAQSAAADAAAEGTYNGEAHAYAVPALTNADGKVLTGVDVAWSETLLTAESPAWNTGSLPGQTDVKAIAAGGAAEAYVLYVRLSHPNYATRIAATRLTVNPAAVTLTAGTRADFPFTLLAGGTPKTWSVTDAHWQLAGLAADTLYAGDTIVYTLDSNTQSTVSAGHAVTFASYGIAVSAHAKNYNIATADGFIRVVQGTAEATLTALPLTFTYDADAHTLPAPTVTVATEDGEPADRTADYTFTYKVTVHGTTTTYQTLPSFTNAGEYTVVVSAASELHATPAKQTVDVTVRRRALTLTSGTLETQYDAQAHTAPLFAGALGFAPDTDHAVDAASLALLAGGQNNATLAGTYAFEIDPGSVRVTGDGADATDNYQIVTVPGLLTIQPTAVSAAQLGLQPVTAVFDGTAHALALPTTLALGGQTVALTDAARFTFAFTTRDTLTAGAPEIAASANPEYTGASSHMVSVYVTDLTGSLVFEPASAALVVNRRDVTITPNSNTFGYNGQPHTVTGHDNPQAEGAAQTGFIGGDYAAVTLTGNTRTNAGSNEIDWETPLALVKGDINNYNLLHGKGTITVLQADELPLTVIADSAVYDGQPHGFAVTAGEPQTAALTLEYSLNGSDWKAFTADGDLPVYTDAGAHRLWVRAGSPNFATAAETNVTLTAAPRPVALAPVGDRFPFDGDAHSLTVLNAQRADVDENGHAVGTSGLVGADGVTVTFTGNGKVNAGTYTVGCENAQAVGGTNLNNYLFSYGTATMAIDPLSDLAVTLTADSAVYDGLSHGFTVDTNAIGAYQLEYSQNGGAYLPFATAAELPALSDEGTVALSVRVTSPNYNAPQAADTATLTVSRAPLTLRVNSESFAYDGAPHALTLTAEGLVSGDTLGAYTLTPADATALGVYTVEATTVATLIQSATRPGNQLSNYLASAVPGTLTIVDFSVTGYGGVYDGQPHGVAVAVPAAFEGLYAVSYAADGAAVAAAPAYVDAGTHTVAVTLTPIDAESGLPTLSHSAEVTVTPKAISLVAMGIDKVYNGAYSVIDVTLPGGAAVNDEDAAAILANLAFRAGGAAVPNLFLNAGTATVTVSSTCPNYVIASATAQVTIAKRAVTVTAGIASKPYDEAPLSVGYTVEPAQHSQGALTNGSGLLQEHTLTAQLTGQPLVNVCDASPVTFVQTATAITGAAGSVLDNYNVIYRSGSITITRAAALALTLQGYAGIYDAAAHSISVAAILDGARTVAADRFTWSFGADESAAGAPAFSRTDAGVETVYVRGVSVDGNYPDVGGYATVNIQPRPVTITPTTASAVYDGQVHTVSTYATERATLGDDGQPTDGRGLLGGDSVSVTLINASQTLPGLYPIGFTGPVMTAGDAGNYQFQLGNAALTIQKATAGLTLSLTDDTVVYDGQPHSLLFTVNAPAGCIYAVSYSTDNGLTYQPASADGLLPAQTAAGQYPFKLRVTSEYFADGYQDNAQATLAISKRPLTITSETNSFVYSGAQHSVSALYSLTAPGANEGLVNAGGVVHTVSAYGFETGYDNTQTQVGGHAVRLDESALVISDSSGANVTANYDVTLEAGRIDVTAQSTRMLETAAQAVYNGQPQGFATPVLLDADGVPVTEPVGYQYSADGVTFSSTPITFENAGDYTVYIRAASANYQSAAVAATLHIAPAPITVAADGNDSFVYTLDGSGNPIEWSVNGASLKAGTLYHGETLAFTLSGNTRSDVGEQDVVLESCNVMLGATDLSANYAVTLQNGHMTVSQGISAAYLTVSDVDGVYNGADYTLPMPAVSVLTTDGSYADQTAQYTLRYSVTRQEDGRNWTFKNTLPHFTDAGTYLVEVSASSSRMATPAAQQANIVISRRPLTVAGGDNRGAPFTYSAATQTVDPWLVLDGTFAPGEDITAYTFADGQSNEGTDVCDRDVTLAAVTLTHGTVDVTANYAITLRPGRLVIQPLAVLGALSLSEVSRVFDGQAHSIGVGDTLSTAVGLYSLSGTTLPGGGARFALAYTVTPAGGAESAHKADNPAFTDAGEYTVTVYVTDNAGNFTVAPQSMAVNLQKRSVTLTPIADAVIYDGLGHSVTAHTHPKALLNEDGVPEGDTGFVGGDDANAVIVNGGPHTNAGDYAVTLAQPVTMLAGNAANYAFTLGSATFTIRQATGIAMSLTADDAVYDGQTHSFTAIAQTPDGCPVVLAYLAEDGSWATVGEGEALPGYVNVGSYGLQTRLTSPNYSDFALRSATLTVSARAVTFASGDNADAPYTYNAAEQSVKAAYVALGSLAAGDMLTPDRTVFATGLGNTATDACDRAVSLTGVALHNASGADVTANYAISYAPGRIVIAPASGGIAPATRTEGYGGRPISFAAPVMTGLAGEPLAGVSYAVSLAPLAAGDPGWAAVGAMPQRTDVLRDPQGGVTGYQLYVRASQPNYQPIVTTSMLTILPEPLVITADTNDGFFYTINADGTPHVWEVNTATITSGTLYNGETLVCAFTGGARSAMGGNDVFISSAAMLFGSTDYSANYAVTSLPGHIAVSRGTATTHLAAEPATAVYDALGHAIQQPMVQVLAQDGSYVTRTEDFTLTYDVARASTGETWHFTSLADMQLTEAGDYTVTVSAASDLHAAPEPVTVALRILPRPLTLQSEDNSAAPYIYNSSEQTVNGLLSIVNLVGGHTVGDAAYAEGQSNAGTDVCDRPVQLVSVKVYSGKTDVTANYAIAYRAGRIVIQSYRIPESAIELQSVDTVYDGQPHSVGLPEFIHTELGDIALSDEFDIAYQNPAARLLRSVASSASANPEFYDVGEYTVNVVFTSRSGNYTAPEATGIVAITPRTLSVTYGELSAAYDGTEHAVTRVIDGLTARDAMQITDRNRSAVDVTRLGDGTPGSLQASAAAWALVDATDPTVDRSGNYTVTVNPGSLEVTPIALLLTADDVSVPYDGLEHAVSDVHAEGLAQGQTVNAVLAGNQGVNVVNAQQPVLASLAVTDAEGRNTTDNYTVSARLGTLTIRPAKLVLKATSLSVTYDGLPHQPEAFAISGLQRGDTLAAFTFLNMPKQAIGRYENVAFDTQSIVLTNRKGEDVTGNYDIQTRNGLLEILAPSAAYTVRYYYDGVLDAGATATLWGAVGSTVTTYPARLLNGYALANVTGLPLVLSKNAAENVIRVYYAGVDRLITLDGLAVPLGAQSMNFEEGLSVE